LEKTQASRTVHFKYKEMTTETSTTTFRMKILCRHQNTQRWHEDRTGSKSQRKQCCVASKSPVTLCGISLQLILTIKIRHKTATSGTTISCRTCFIVRRSSLSQTEFKVSNRLWSPW